jgi:hypothetical protein
LLLATLKNKLDYKAGLDKELAKKKKAVLAKNKPL